MEVVVWKQSDFNKVLRKLRTSGGEATTAYNKIATIRQSIEIGETNPGRITDHGERRVKNCIKYKLTDNYRLVTVQTGGLCFFLFAGTHDEADHWLDQHTGWTPTIDEKSKRLSVVYVEEEKRRPKPNLTPVESTAPLLAQLSGIDWKSIIPSNTLRNALLKINADTDDEEIIAIHEDIERIDVDLAACFIDLVDLLRQGKLRAAEEREALFLGGRRPVEATEVLGEEVLSDPVNSDVLVRLGRLTEEQQKLWEDPAKFQEWILFPHPDQRRIIDEDFDRPTIVGGVSGSGKTCALVHRALRLAGQYKERVLILTLNRSLANLIETLIRLLPGSADSKIEVLAYYDYLARLLEHWGLQGLLSAYRAVGRDLAVDTLRDQHGPRGMRDLIRPRQEDEIAKKWQRHAEERRLTTDQKREVERLEIYLYDQDTTLDLGRYLRQELDLVRSSFRTANRYEGYASDGYPRRGRAIQMAENRRGAVLALLDSWERYQISKAFHDEMQLTQAAILMLDRDRGKIPEGHRYRSVLVDEYQDFATLDLLLLQRIPTARENGLFLTGDLAQRIYPKELDLSRGDLPQTARVHRRINKNYRNTHQILEAATALLNVYGGTAAAQEGGVEVLKPEYAERNGPKPFACRTQHPVSAAWAYACQRLTEGYIGFSVCIATADPIRFPVEEILEKKPEGIAAGHLTGDYVLEPEKVVVANLSEIKGFEFCLIAIVGLDRDRFPAAGYPAGEHWREALRLYVAMTRGRDEVRLFYKEKPSAFIEAMWDSLTHMSVAVDAFSPGGENVLDEVEPDDLEEDLSSGIDSLNGYTFVRLRRPVSIRTLERGLARSNPSVANTLYGLEHFPTGNDEIPDHIVTRMLKSAQAIPRFVGLPRLVTRAAAASDANPEMGVLRIKEEVIAGTCRFCSRHAMPGEDLCFGCAGKE